MPGGLDRDESQCAGHLCTIDSRDGKAIPRTREGRRSLHADIRAMRTLRLAPVCLAVLAAVTLVSGAAFAKGAKPTAAPHNLRGFLLRPSEALQHDFPRTPAFAWSPVKGANCYEFELGTSKSFTENAIIWSNVRYGIKPGSGCKSVPASSATDTATTAASTAAGDTAAAASSTTTPTPATPTTGDPNVTSVIQPLRIPAVSVDIALPWFTGQPYALYAHVRAITKDGPTSWSNPFAFNMTWPSVPTPLPTQSGLVRWTPIQGATGYQVWFRDFGVSKVFSTSTNVADEREYYTWHANPSSWATVHWRVRAVRRVFGDIPNGLPATSYGPWSPVYVATNPDRTAGPLSLQLAISDRTSSGKAQSAHELMPGFTFSGDQGIDGISHAFPLYRVYISTDRECVNVVYRGAVVGSPAYAPRTSGPLKLPVGDDQVVVAKQGWLPDGTDEGPTYTIDGAKVTTSESTAASSSSSGGDSAAAGSSAPAVAHVDLPDVDFPATRYFWTVVPVIPAKLLSDDSDIYTDTEVPQDACAAGRVFSFGKESDPVSVASSTPYVAGLTPGGRLLAAAGKKPFVFSTPLVAWKPATAATSYEVQWSRTRYPWRAQGSKLTYSTSAVLDLAPGQWYYRVRGLNQIQLRKPQMVWSSPVKLTVAAPKFKLVASAAPKATKSKQKAAKKK
jgi:hypothetical protein